MRILLDENLDWRLCRELPGHEAVSVGLLGWSGTKNGMLLRKSVDYGFDALLTMDGNMVHQQNLATFDIAVIALRARSNRIADTRPLMPRVLAALPHLRHGVLTVIE